MIMMYTALLAMMQNAANFASVADDMTCLMMCAVLSTAPLLPGTLVSPDKNKFPPALFLTFGSLT